MKHCSQLRMDNTKDGVKGKQACECGFSFKGEPLRHIQSFGHLYLFLFDAFGSFKLMKYVYSNILCKATLGHLVDRTVRTGLP